MVVANLHFGGIQSLPAEADPPLVIDPNGVPSSTVPLQSLKAVARRDSEIGKLSGGIKLDELAKRNAGDTGITGARSALMQSARLIVLE